MEGAWIEIIFFLQMSLAFEVYWLATQKVFLMIITQNLGSYGSLGIFQTHS